MKFLGCRHIGKKEAFSDLYFGERMFLQIDQLGRNVFHTAHRVEETSCSQMRVHTLKVHLYTEERK